MKFWHRDENWTGPIDSPAYPPPPAHYRDVMFQMVYFTCDPKNISPLLPAPLEPASSGQCCVFGIDAKFCAEYGPFKEMGVALGCMFEGRDGFFLSSLFLDSSDPIAPGREIYGSPKKLARVTMTQEGNELTSTATRADVPMIQINSRITEPAEPDEVPALFPLFVLKVIPSADAQRPAVKQLLEGAPPEDMTVDRLFKGPGVVNFTPTVAGDFWRLAPRTFDGAVYQVCSYKQGYSKILKDYLA